MEIPGPQASQPVEAQYAISVLKVKEDATWSQLEEDLSNIWAAHLGEVITGLRTKKTTRFDVESPDSPTAFSLGLSQNSVKHYSMGKYTVKPCLVDTPVLQTVLTSLFYRQVMNVGSLSVQPCY